MFAVRTDYPITEQALVTGTQYDDYVRIAGPFTIETCDSITGKLSNARVDLVGGVVWNADGLSLNCQRSSDSLPPLQLGDQILWSGMGMLLVISAGFSTLPWVFIGSLWLLAKVNLDAKIRMKGSCPQCGYSLRGAKTAGCPECGWGREENESRK